MWGRVAAVAATCGYCDCHVWDRVAAVAAVAATGMWSCNLGDVELISW